MWILALFFILLGVGLLADIIIEKYFGTCPTCEHHSVKTTEVCTGRDSSYRKVLHYYVTHRCRHCGWHEEYDKNDRPDK